MTIKISVHGGLKQQKYNNYLFYVIETQLGLVYIFYI